MRRDSSRHAREGSLYARARPELMDLLAAAEGLLAATGQAVALCPNYGCTDESTTVEDPR